MSLQIYSVPEQHKLTDSVLSGSEGTCRERKVPTEHLSASLFQVVRSVSTSRIQMSLLLCM